jgi:hypothetical protein
MPIPHQSHSSGSARRSLLALAAIVLLLPQPVIAQSLTGSLIVVVTDANRGLLAGATVRVSSPALLGGPSTLTTDDKGERRFLTLPPGLYVLEVSLPGFAPAKLEAIDIAANATIERSVPLNVVASAAVVVEGVSSRIEARDSGFGTRVSSAELATIPARHASLFGPLRSVPGISPTSPSSGTATTTSSFGSGTNENQFLFDGGNITCPCNGVARSEPGLSFIQELQIQSIGASAEYGNMQGAVINVVSRQGSEHFLFDAATYWQPGTLTSRPIFLAPVAGATPTGYARARYRDVTTSLGGPAIRDRLWFFVGYEHFRDHDSQPGSDPAFPRQYEQDKVFGKLTWKLSSRLQLVQSFHGEYGINPERPTFVTPYQVTSTPHISVPSLNFGHLTRTISANTLWDVRAGRFVFTMEDAAPDPSIAISSRFDRATGVTSGGPSALTTLTIIRNTAKATLNHYRPGWLGANHLFKVGTQIERGEHHARSFIPTGVRYLDVGGVPSERITSQPGHAGGVSLTGSLFASDAITIDRLTVNAGVRFDHSRALHQDLHKVDEAGRETSEVVPGGGTLYAWNIVSPRLGVTLKLTADGRTILRSSYGWFSQGVLTGELQFFHPGASVVTMTPYQLATQDYTGVPRHNDPKVNLSLDRGMRAPRTKEFSIGIDREIGRRLAVSAVFVRKDGSRFIGWEDTAGVYTERPEPLADGRTVTVFDLDTSVTPARDRRFHLTNQHDYFLTYNGLVLAAERRRSGGWQASGSYTFSRAEGLQASSGAAASGVQASTVSPPQPLTFGRDPNDLTNARGRLPNDRPHIFRVMGSVDVPRTGVALAGSLQHFTGKPWAASALIPLRQGEVRVLLEPRGTRRLSSQTLVDLRVSRPFRLGAATRIELILDVLNALNDTAEEGLATDHFYNAAFGRPTVFMDPRRAMLSLRFNLGR